jgi:hypothetical protein
LVQPWEGALVLAVVGAANVSLFVIMGAAIIAVTTIIATIAADVFVFLNFVFVFGDFSIIITKY